MSVKITYFVHGTTTDNLEHKSTGWLPGELSKKGIEQSLALKEQIDISQFDVVFCSDLQRAIDSAKYTFEGVKEIVQDERLRECNYGDFNGQDSTLANYEDHISERFPNGESMLDVEKRIKSFCDYLLKNYDGKHIAIVAHKAPQLAFQVLTEGKSWKLAIEQDWRKTKSWQPGWIYNVEKIIMNLNEINQRISDRTDCFYWQTDRKISAEEAALIWKDRHSAITNEELVVKINAELKNDKLVTIKPFDENAQTSLGNVNSIRIGILASGKEVIIRCHPKGVRNGYFHVESLAATTALNHGIPAYRTYSIHELDGESDISYQVIEKLNGDTVQFFLKEHPEAEEKLVFEMGRMMARLHKIKVNGFGTFDNEQAKRGTLVGIHSSLKSSINAGLEENLERLVKYNILSQETADKMRKLFENNPLLNSDVSVLIHNDFADWNLLTDGNSIVGVIDWDECVAGNPIQEIACWSTFFDPERIKPFLEGYFSETSKYDNFDEMFQLMRLRYTISKMALRIKRYTYEQTPFLKSMIEKGEKHLEELSEIFSLTESSQKLKKYKRVKENS